MIRRRFRAVLIGVCALLGVGAVGYHFLRARVRPNIVFILVDTLRADRLGDYGRLAGLAPFLTGLGERSVVFDRAYSASSWTVPAVISLFVGQRPFEHSVMDFLVPLAPRHVTLAEVLAAHGYDTAGFLASGVIANGAGFGQGFAEYKMVGPAEPQLDEVVDASEVNAAATAWLDHRPLRGLPFFLYLHYMEPHWPYKAHEGITPESKTTTSDQAIGHRAISGNTVKDDTARARAWKFSQADRERLRELYDGEVTYLDRRLAELFEALDRRQALANTIVVVTADHGEELGEHGIFGHGASLFDSEIHVPLIVHVPGQPPAHVTRPVETAGVGAALLEAVGIEPPTTFQVAAIPLRADASTSTVRGPAPVSQLAKILNFSLWFHRTAIIDGNRKLVVTADGLLGAYDLGADPEERRLLAATSAEVARADAFDRYSQYSARQGKPPPMDETTLARLRALGYVGAP